MISVNKMSVSKEQHLRNSNGLVFNYLLIFSLVLFLSFTFLSNQSSQMLNPLDIRSKSPALNPRIRKEATNLSHIQFVLVGSLKGWRKRKSIIESWWRPNITRGNLFLDVTPTQEFLPWPKTSPPFRVSEDLKKLRVYHKLQNPIHIRIYRSIYETFKLNQDENIRWYVTGDEDTLFFLDNIVSVLNKYDDTKNYYIGMHAESTMSNFRFSFEMAFGGGGYAMSYPLVQFLVTKQEECIERYAHMWAGDQLAASCLADMGVDITRERGFHQLDLVGDISGYLSSHPHSPLLSLHHIDKLHPFFPFMNMSQSVKHLMRSAEVDQSRMLQQTICYNRQTNWSFSLAWGYSLHIYENILPRSHLIRPIETFGPWAGDKPPYFMFNTRPPTADPCEAPHWFFFDSIDEKVGDHGAFVSNYSRRKPRNLTTCWLPGSHSADVVRQIRVLTPRKPKEAERIECCDVEFNGTETTTLKLRACGKHEVLA